MTDVLQQQLRLYKAKGLCAEIVVARWRNRAWNVIDEA
jgi:hypothetical protein